MSGNGEPEHEFDNVPIEHLSPDVTRAIAAPDRRVVLRYLAETGTAELDRLALVVSGLSTYGGDGRLATAEDYRRTRIELHHVHLPQLARAGLVVYDAENVRVAAGADIGAVGDLLDEFDALEPEIKLPGAVGDPRSAVDHVSRLDAPITSLREFLAAVTGGETTVRLFAPTRREDAVPEFVDRNVRVKHESLPPPLGPGFAVVERDGIRGICRLDVLTGVEEPPTTEPWDEAPDRTDYRQFLGLFRDTQFTTTDRGQLLATSREIEDRAWRTAAGALHAGFQSLSVFRSQAPLYEKVAEQAGLDVSVYGRPDWTPPQSDDVTTITAEGGELGEFWFVVYRDPTGRNSCALLAEEHSPDEYVGAWTYDAETVDHLVTYLEETYGPGKG